VARYYYSDGLAYFKWNDVHCGSIKALTLVQFGSGEPVCGTYEPEKLEQAEL
jgi:hypothetical protein